MTETVLATIVANGSVENDILCLSTLVAVDGVEALVQSSIFQLKFFGHVKERIEEPPTLCVVKGENDDVPQ